MNRVHLTSVGAAGNGLDAKRGGIWSGDHRYATGLAINMNKGAAGRAVAAPEIANHKGWIWFRLPSNIFPASARDKVC
jgi:hypothetical protein